MAGKIEVDANSTNQWGEKGDGHNISRELLDLFQVKQGDKDNTGHIQDEFVLHEK